MSRALILLALLCAGCSPSINGTYWSEKDGCQYYMVDGKNSSYPRIDADGKQICGKGK